MNFITLTLVIFFASAAAIAFDFFVSRKQRAEKLAAALQSKKLDYPKRKAILAKPEWVNTADFFFVLSSVALVVWYLLPNFELILVVALLISLALTLVEKLYMEKRKKADEKALYFKNPNPHEEELADTRKMPWWVDYGWSFFPLLLLIVGLRSFFYEPFKIPSGSMESTLWVHDFILVNKYEYGLRLPVTKTKMTSGNAPQRGDVIVFRAPHEPDKDYIKRLIALPGDKVYYQPDHSLFIEPNCSNEQAAESAREAGLVCGQLNQIQHRLKQKQGFGSSDVYTETIAGVEHDILIDPAKLSNPVGFGYYYSAQNHKIYEQAQQQYPELTKRLFFSKTDYSSYIEDWANGVTIPEGNYFALGDNRTGSSDSRFWGFIPEERLVGKADYVWLHLEFAFDEGIDPMTGEQKNFFHWVPTGVNFDRPRTIH